MLKKAILLKWNCFRLTGGDASIFPKTSNQNLIEQNHVSNVDTTTTIRKRKSTTSEQASPEKITRHKRLSDNESNRHLKQLKIDSVYDDLTNNEVSQSEPLERLNSFSIDSNNQNKLSELLNNRTDIVDNDLFRTGAKCVPNGLQDPLRTGNEYHTVGPLRIKPGRGFRTISMSCSDKMMKWCVLGLQGGLLANLIAGDGIFLSTIIVASPYFDDMAFHRALSFRGRRHQHQQQQPKTIINEKVVEVKTERYLKLDQNPLSQQQLQQRSQKPSYLEECKPQQQQSPQQEQQQQQQSPLQQEDQHHHHQLECNTLEPKDVQVFHIKDRLFIDSRENVRQRLNDKSNSSGKLTSSGVGKKMSFYPFNCQDFHCF